MTVEAPQGRPPIVSCVIIFLNAERYLEEAIRSVYAQTWEDWELILVDDGSTDGSTAIAWRHAGARPDRVRYEEHPGHENRGMSASRNLGIARSRGELIALLDADDVWLPEKLATQVAVLRSHPDVGMTYDASLMWNSWAGGGAAAPEDRLRRLGVPTGVRIDPPTLVPLFLGGEAEAPGTCSVLIRRRVVEQVGGFVEAFRGLFEDQAFFFKVCLETPVLVTGGHTALYRQHAESCCQLAETDGAYHPDRPNTALQTFLDWLADYVTARLAAGDVHARRLPADLRAFMLEQTELRRGLGLRARVRRAAKRAARGFSPRAIIERVRSTLLGAAGRRERARDGR